MKRLFIHLLVFMALSSGTSVSLAQGTKKDKKAAKAALIKGILDSSKYIFSANYVIPQRGISKSLNYDYDVTVLKDTVKAYLPYYGRAYVAPTDPTDGGIKFTSTDFKYVKTLNKNGSYDIVITPHERAKDFINDVRYLCLTVSLNGTAYLQVVSTNRENISFNGEVGPVKNSKSN